MTDASIVFALVGIAAVLFASGRIRLDIVALLVVLTLMLSGILTPGEAVAGFGDSVVLLVVCLLVVGEMLARTGVAHRISDVIVRFGGQSEAKLTAMIMVAAALLSGVMSSTAVVAIFIPIVVNIARTRGLHASRMLMPLSFAALIGGMITLIATPPNLVVSGALAESGHAPLQFFSFTLVGLAILPAGILYMLLVGRRGIGAPVAETESAAPEQTLGHLADNYVPAESLHVIRIPAESPLVGLTVDEASLGDRYNVRILATATAGQGRRSAVEVVPLSWALKGEQDLVAVATDEDIGTLIEMEHTSGRAISAPERKRLLKDVGLTEVLIHPESRMIGQKLDGTELWSRYGVRVLGVRRNGSPLADHYEVSLKPGDAVLFIGEWDRLAQLATARHDFVVLDFPDEMKEVAPARRKAPIAVAILAGMVLLTIFNVVPMLAAVMLAALAAVATRCLTMDEAYRAIHWSSIVLLAGMLPVAVALEKTGGLDLIVNGMVAGLGDSGPYVLFSMLFWVTALLGLFLSNTATSVVMAPIAIQAAGALGVSPYPLAIGIIVAASAGFASPVSSPVVTLVVEPGRYRFMDFVKVGLPLMVLVYGLALFLIPLLFPFGG